MRNSVVAPAALFAAALAVQPALAAEDAAYSPEYGQCMDQATSPVDMARCVDEEHQRQDKRLNEIYAQLRKIMEPAQFDLVKQGQRAFIKQKELDAKICALPNEGGTQAAVDSASCVLEATRARVRFLGALRDALSL
ncbi:MAG: DUF1311 domain-containing protein [Succinivibrionaceae bacterium]|nr:DUF1311 domain-containing protein [Succinivibrionaceae bacterium]